jgi:Protein of unknown function (DUF3224)
MAQATGSFTVKSWDENTYAELDGDGKLTKASVAFTLEGELAGEATWDAVMCYRPDGSAVYTGYQQMTGELDGRQGSFVLLADGEFVNGEARSRWLVVEGTGTGGLAGLTGSGSATATATPPGTFSFDYDLG